MAVTQISRSQCRELKSAPGFVLRTDAAIAFDNACMAFGKDVIVTGTWRSYETQVSLFTTRYKRGAHSPYGDYRYWRGVRYGRTNGAAAAVPGTSNHGGGVAFDAKTRRDSHDRPRSDAVVFTAWSDSDRRGWLAKAAKFGWRDTEGRRVGELWHITYYPHLDHYRGKVLGKGGSTSKPAPSKPAAPKKRRPHVVHTIKLGMKDDWAVKLWQEFLNEANDSKLKVDGDFGPTTKRETVEWQKKAKLTPDGVVGEHTWFRACYGVKPNRRGARVKVCQRMLGLTGKNVDGVAGKTYVTRSKEVQRWLNVPADAKWGLKSLDALLKKG